MLPAVVPHPPLPEGAENPDGPWGYYASDVSDECTFDARTLSLDDPEQLKKLGATFRKRKLLCFTNFLDNDDRIFLFGLFERMAKARSACTRLNGSKTFQYKFWKGLDFEKLVDAPEVKLTTEERERFARLRARVRAFCPVLEIFSRGFTHLDDSKDFFVTEAAWLQSEGTSQGAHLDDLQWLFFNGLVNCMPYDTWSTWVLDYSLYPNLKNQYPHKDGGLWRDCASYMPQMLDLRSLRVLRVRVPPGALWFFPSTIIHGGTGYNPTGLPRRRAVLYLAVMTRTCFRNFNSARTVPYYHLLLAKLYHKYAAARATYDVDPATGSVVPVTHGPRAQFTAAERETFISEEVARLRAEDPLTCEVLQQWRRFSPDPARFSQDGAAWERLLVDQVAQRLVTGRK
jgi:hypothetical protein